MPRICLFCPEQAGSGEHIWADWLNGVFEVEKSDLAKGGWVREIANDDSIELRSWQKSEIANLTTNLVCRDCNTGWMARLEGRARPLLTPMIKGFETELTLDQQFLAATWAVKTVMVVDATLGHEDRFLKEQCEIVRTQDRPPASVEVIITAVEGSIPLLNYFSFGIRAVANRDAEDERIFFHTIQVGTLVFQVVRRVPPQANYGTLERIAIPRQLELQHGLAVPIFPPTLSATWPGDGTLSWQGVIDFAHRGQDVPDGWVIPFD
jgi:hypothetical protein